MCHHRSPQNNLRAGPWCFILLSTRLAWGVAWWAEPTSPASLIKPDARPVVQAPCRSRAGPASYCHYLSSVPWSGRDMPWVLQQSMPIACRREVRLVGGQQTDPMAAGADPHPRRSGIHVPTRQSASATLHGITLSMAPSRGRRGRAEMCPVGRLLHHDGAAPCWTGQAGGLIDARPYRPGERGIIAHFSPSCGRRPYYSSTK